MASNDTSVDQAPPQSLQEQATQAAIDGHLKAINDSAYDQTQAGLKSGAAPQDLSSHLLDSLSSSKSTAIPSNAMDALKQIVDLSNKTYVPSVAGMDQRFGLIPGLIHMAQGKGFDAFQPIPQMVGPDLAKAAIDTQMTQQKNAVEIPKMRAELLSNLINIAKATQNRGMLDALNSQISGQQGQGTPQGTQQPQPNQSQSPQQPGQQVNPDTVPEMDPLTNQLTTKGIAQKTGAENQMALQKEARTKFQGSTSDMVTALDALDKLKETAKGLPDYKSGLYNQVTGGVDASLRQKSQDPAMIKYTASLGRLSIPLTRLSIGNSSRINNVELNAIKSAAGDITTPYQTKADLLDSFRNTFTTRLKTEMEQSGITPQELNKQVPTLYSKLYPINTSDPSLISELKKRKLHNG